MEVSNNTDMNFIKAANCKRSVIGTVRLKTMLRIHTNRKT